MNGRLNFLNESWHFVIYLSDLFKGLWVHICKYITLRQWEYLEGHSTVVILQGRDVIVAHCQLSTSIDLVPAYIQRYIISSYVMEMIIKINGTDIRL